MIKITVDENSTGKRLDCFLAEVNPEFSRSKIQNFIKSVCIKVNGELKKSSYILHENDEIDFSAPEAENLKVAGENIPLDILYEDENMLVVNKPSGQLTHPTPQERTGTLVNALIYKYGENLSDLNGEFRRGILHRLDRNTSGLLMVAKNNKAHEFLAEQIKNHEVIKKYRAIVNGNYKSDEDIIELPIGRHPKYTHKMAVVADGKPAKTVVKVQKRFFDATLLELTLITGRTHQIRVHLAHKKHPVYNDTLYGGTGKVTTEEQVLQSFYLSFKKPFSDEIITIEIPFDKKIEKVLKYLENRSK